MRERSPSGVRIVNLYSSPAPTPLMSADHEPDVPSPSRASAVPSMAQSSNVPVTNTASAWGAQTRNVVPSLYGMAPIPGRFEGDGIGIGREGTPASLLRGVPNASRAWDARLQPAFRAFVRGGYGAGRKSQVGALQRPKTLRRAHDRS